MRSIIDVSFDFRSDSAGRDPDAYSRTLRQYHKLLWSKHLPSGVVFELDDKRRGTYLYHNSEAGEFFLSSDTVVPSFSWSLQIQQGVARSELEAFNAIGYTIGAMMVFPSNSIDRKWTINQARGCLWAIRDRFDLTLECIRRFYTGGLSPLAPVLERYASFFKLFVDFRGYVEFFHLNDLVDADFTSVRICEPFDDFKRSPIPTVAEYEAYKNASIAFIQARNRRIHSALTNEVSETECQ